MYRLLLKKKVRGLVEQRLAKTLLKDCLVTSSDQQNSGVTKKRVLVATSLGGYHMGSIFESLLGKALEYRGCEVDVLLCDGALPACQHGKLSIVGEQEYAKTGPELRCDGCFKFGSTIAEKFGLNLIRYSDFSDDQIFEEARYVARETNIDEIALTKLEDVNIGEQALAGALRYFGVGKLNSGPISEAVIRRYLQSAVLSTRIVGKIIEKNNYDIAVFHHGIYVPQGCIGEVCRQHNVRVVNWVPSYRKGTFIFSHNDSYHRTMITEDTERWKSVKFSLKQKTKIETYLKQRIAGTQDWIKFHKSPQVSWRAVSKRLGITGDRKIVTLLTNVMWDAQLHYESNAFENMLDWIFLTIQEISHKPDLLLVIRIHPAEITGSIPSRQKVAEEIEKEFPNLPGNVIVVGPEDNASTYTLIRNSNAVCIYNTKTGIEAACMGKHVIVCGEAWIRNKGFSIDIQDRDSYRSTLRSLPFKADLSDKKIELAKKYAYHFFFRRMISLPFFNNTNGNATPSLDLLDTSDLKKGKHDALDAICNGIIHGTPFEHESQ